MWVLALAGVIGTDPSGRLSVANIPAGVIACGSAPLVLLTMLVLGILGKLPGTTVTRKVKALSAEEYWKCPKCNYDMASVKGDICPECGESFSLKRK